MKHAILVEVALALGLGALGCTKDAEVHVECRTVETPAVECTVTEVKGTMEVEACWDFEVTCGNGAVVTAERTCQKVKDGATENVTIPADKLTGVDKCGGDAPQAKVSNLTLNGKAVN